MRIETIHIVSYCKKCSTISFWNYDQQPFELGVMKCVECGNNSPYVLGITMYPCNFEELFVNPMFDVTFDIVHELQFDIEQELVWKLFEPHPLDSEEFYEFLIA